MPYITVGAENSGPIDLYYEDHGSGQPVVLIHGFPLSSTAWEKQIPGLLSAGCRTVAYDRRGFGKSSQPVTGYDYDTFADDLNMIMTELDLRDAILVGHSMGTGEITRYLSTFGSDRVSRAVLISALPPFLLKTSDNSEAVDKSVFDGFMQAILKDRYAYQTSFLNDFFNYDQTKGKLVSEEAYRANWEVAVSASAIGTRMSVETWETDFRNDLPNINVPLLIIHGEDDRVLPYPMTAPRVQAAVANSQLVTIKGAPHAIPWTHADEVNKAMMDFISAGSKVMAH